MQVIEVIITKVRDLIETNHMDKVKAFEKERTKGNKI